MTMRWSLAVAVFLAMAGLCLPALIHADGGDEFFIHVHEVASYPDAVQALHESTDGVKVQLTRDSVDKVAAFFGKRLQKDDKLEPFREENREGMKLVYHISHQGKDHPVLLATVEKSLAPEESYPIFGELDLQVQRGRHTQADLDKVKKEYGFLMRAFYRQVQGPEGPEDEGKIIYDKYVKLAHPEAEKMEAYSKKQESKGNRAREKAKAAEMKKRIKAMQAAGDYAGMMKLSQEAREEKEEEIGLTTEEMLPGHADSWDTWIQCLKELKAAAYTTRITYQPGTLPE